MLPHVAQRRSRRLQHTRRLADTVVRLIHAGRSDGAHERGPSWALLDHVGDGGDAFDRAIVAASVRRVRRLARVPL